MPKNGKLAQKKQPLTLLIARIWKKKKYNPIKYKKIAVKKSYFNIVNMSKVWYYYLKDAKEGDHMSSYLMFTEITTPFKLIGIRVFKDENGKYWYKYKNNKRKRIFK
ncbi:MULTISPECIES: hypothetical protein [Bacillales]|uniref:hypothetical protein n=1 Tax=Bacillales TaxID=1385 RepID=UPI0006A79625|nr:MULTISPECIES: hypothetical protein [Bacillales]OBZ11218.1 hypothetical protein A7975_19890 [Bacillus sp. FJAT-26390]